MQVEIKQMLNQELRARTPAAAVGALFLCPLFFGLTQLSPFHFIWAGIAALVIMVSSVFRYILINKSIKLNSVFILTSALGWSVLSTGVFLTFNFQATESQMMLLFLSGIASSALITLTANPKVFKIYVALILIIPPGVHALVLYDTLSIKYLIIFLTYLVFLLKLSSVYYQGLVHNFENTVKLDQERSVLQTILDTVPGFLSYIDKNLKYVSMNSNLRNALGLKEHECKGKNVGFLNDDDEWTRQIKMFSDSPIDSYNVEAKLKFGLNERWHLISMRKSKDQLWIICISVDIHQEKMLQSRPQRWQRSVKCHRALHTKLTIP